ncbi:MAG TPA: RecQ family ATP-dependent DNA helicase, partial [Gemmatimonadota bacterium]|nr:RecQ family ATP-dependent DNA helicase [Gemmatimonadota bacterium]
LPVLALTATATRTVAADIVRQLGMRKPDGFKGSFFRPNLELYCRKKGTGNTRREILALVRRHAGESGIVYCLSRRSVERTAEFLERRGVKAVAYHAGLDDGSRTAAQDAFARDEIDVVVATVAFGMGIDKSNVRFVIHRDMPPDIESWYQEFGRAGRDGLPSECVLFYSWADVKVRERFLAEISDDGERELRRRAMIGLFRLADGDVCRHRALVAHFDEELPDCGTSCDVCLGAAIEDLIGSVEAPVGADRRGGGTARRRGATAEGDAPRSPSDPTFQRLRALRKRLADHHDVPAYVIFSDRTLWDMIDRRPRSLGEMLDVHGVGSTKLERYGDEFLSALREE